MKLIDEKPTVLAEVKNILGKKKKEYKEKDKELLYEQNRAFDHAKSASKLSSRDSVSLVKKLLVLGLDLTEERCVKIADLLPETVDDVRAIFAKERFKYEEEEIKKVIDVVDQYK